MRRGGEVTAEKLAAVEADLAQAEADLAAADAEHESLLAQVSGDLAIEALTASAAEAKTRPSAERLEQARTRAEQLRRAVPELRQRLAAREQREREAQERAAAKALTDGCRKAQAAATKLAEKLREAEEAATALVRQRVEVDRLATESAGARMDDASPRPVERRRPQTLLRAGIGRTPGWLDEPRWADGIDVLRRVLEDGPRRPLADAEVEAQRQQAEREGQDRELSAWVRHHPSRAAQTLARDDLSDALRAEIEQIAADFAAAAAARRTGDAERQRSEQEREREEVTL